MSRWFFIEANDVLMFRDSRPFQAGQHFTARSTFPPNPRTMQGIVRTHILETQGVDLAAYGAGRAPQPVLDVVGTPERLGTLRLDGPFVARWQNGGVERLFRVPLDVLQPKGSDGARTPVTLRPGGRAGFETEAPFEGWQPLAVPQGDTGYEEVSGWLTEDSFKAYLRGDPITEVIDDGEVFMREVHVGLGIDYSRRGAQEGRFYHAEFVRLVKRPEWTTGLLVGIDHDGGLFPERGAMIIGGESRPVTYEEVSVAPLPAPGAGRIRVVLLTPAYFGEGWRPRSGEWAPWVGGGRLVSVALGKPERISGWNLARGAPRPLRHFVPAGSVYYFEGASWQGQPFTEAPDDDPDYAAMGFGAVAIGAW